MTRHQPQANLPWAVALIALWIAALWIAWIGFLNSDDGLYYIAAAHWVDAPPFEGDNHWATRFPVVMSFAALIAVLGKGFTAFHVMSIGWFAALIAITGLFARSIAGPRAGWIGAILVATMPTLATFGSIVNCDMPESVFTIGGAWLLGISDKGRRPMLLGLLAGICLGLAVLSRETGFLPIFGLLPIFLVGKPVRRQVLIASGIGFAVVILGEMAFQWAMTGEPLRRYVIAFNHDHVMSRAANAEGNFLIHPAIDPVLVLLINDDFAILFWLGIAAVAARAWRNIPADGQRRLLVLSLMGIANFLLVAVLVHKLVLNPRYFALAALTICVIVAIWLANMDFRKRTILLAAAVGTNLLAMSLANDHPRWVVDALLIAAQEHPQAIVVSDRDTRERAGLPLRFAGLTNAVAGAPTPGQLYLSSDALQPPVHATVVKRYVSPPTVLGGVLRLLHLDGLLPGGIGRRLLTPNPSATLWMIDPA